MLVEFAAYLMNQCDIGSDGKTSLHKTCMDEGTTHGFWILGRRSCWCLPNQQEGNVGPAILSWSFVGMLNSSSEAVVVTEQRLGIKTRAANVGRVLESERWDADRILGICAHYTNPARNVIFPHT